MGSQITSDAWSARRAEVARNIHSRWAEHARAGGTTDMAPEPFSNSVSVYTDPQRLAAEKRELFNSMPIVAGLSCDIPEPGDMLMFDEAGPSILITRDEDRKVHAFLNMCTHRGARLVQECQRRRLISCPFHAWSFDLKGNLKGLPGQEGFPGIPRESRGLVPVPVIEWHGFIFVIARPGNEPIDIEAHLGTYADELAQMQLEHAVPVKSGVLEVKSNWKYALDTYGEGYHFGRLHASTIGQTHFTNVTVFEPFGYHHRVSFPFKSVADYASKPEVEWPELEYTGIHLLFPNTNIFYGSITPGQVFVQMFRLFPGATPGETRTVFSIYAPRPIENEAYRKEVEFAFDATAQVVATEDYRVAAEGWANLSKAPKDFRVLYGRNEIALQHQHRNIAEAIGMPLE